MSGVMELMRRASLSGCDTLIEGEQGSGRETVARAIHSAGPAEIGQFVSLDCAAIEPEHIEAELFDTSATQQKVRVSLNRTLFLRRLMEAPRRAQARLAQLLWNRPIVRAQPHNGPVATVRVIGALEPMSHKGVGRRVEPLLLDRFPIRIALPPLRKRKEDIPALATWFLEHWCASTGSAPKRFSTSALALLAAFPWQGNGKELGRFIAAVAANVRGTVLGPDELLAQVRFDSGALAAYHLPLREARRRFEHEYIATVIEQHHGRIDQAAHALGIRRTNLYRKLRQLRAAKKGVRSETETPNWD
jgi:two-component system nitrogen regulation response regulator NtrX